MLRSLKDLEGYTASATDGDVGVVDNFFLDDGWWIVRYLVVATGGLLGGRRVLISPLSFREVDWSSRRFHLALTIERIKGSPSVALNQPVSRQHEEDHARYYDNPPYWGGLGPRGSSSPPGQPAPSVPGDVHLRSVGVVRGYGVEGTDGAIGHIADFIVDDESWEVRYLVIDVGHWWNGKMVLVAPHWASRISWDERKVHLDLTRRAIQGSPPWDPAAPVNREYETRLYDYYGRPAYWPSGTHRP
jgi:hypothetical protein